MKCTNREVNEAVARLFMNDSRGFLERFEKLRSPSTEMGNRCKLLVDIRFAIECALKALIFFESTEDEKNTYRRVKRLGHKLENLCQDPIVLCHPDIVGFYADIQSLKLDEYDVCLRYSLEANIEFGSFEQRGDYYIMVDNLLNNNKIYEVAQNIYNEINKLHPFLVETKNNSTLDIEKIVEIQQRIRAISS